MSYVGTVHDTNTISINVDDIQGSYGDVRAWYDGVCYAQGTPPPGRVNCGFEAPYTLDNLTGQGNPAWGNVLMGYDTSGTVVNTQAYEGTQSLYLTGYESAAVTFPVASHCPWFEFAWKPAFDMMGNDYLQIWTTNGQIWFTIDDGSGVDLKAVASAGSDVPTVESYVVVNGVVSCELSGDNIVPVVLMNDQSSPTVNAWQTISFRQDYSTGGVDAYVNGQFKGHYTVESGSTYSGLKTFGFTTTVPGGVGWELCGSVYVDSIHVEDDSVFVSAP